MTVHEQIKVRDEEIKRLKKENEALMEKVAQLARDLESLRKSFFGKKSEKHPDLDANQLDLFNQEEVEAKERAEADTATQRAEAEMAKAVRPKKRPARKPIDTSSLPEEVIDLYPGSTADSENNLKDEYEEIGTEETVRIERVPAKVYVVKIIRHKVMRKSDKGKNPEDRQILTPALPLVPIPKCIAGASVLADIIIGKFLYHLPFYRQIQQYKEYGITISDSTMGGWFEGAIERLKPLYDLLKRKILSSEYIQIDESVIPVLDDEKHKARKGYMWCVRDGIAGDVMFHYDLGSRAGKVARELLCNYHGIVQSDGYEAYDQFRTWRGITLAGCWTHVRRKWFEALEENKKMATQAICYIEKLYKVESEADAAGLSAEERKAKRQLEAKPVIEAFTDWIMNPPFDEKVSAQSRTGRAFKYTHPLLQRLRSYLDDGRVNIDNNLIENAIRPLAIGRKNYLFCGNDAAAYRAAIAYSLIGSCKAAGVDPRVWMEDVLKKIPYYERDGRDMAELLPGSWRELAENSSELTGIAR